MNEPIKTVGVLIFDNNAVLLVCHTEGSEHLNNIYGIPAGRIAENELSAQTAIRELFEETNLSTNEESLKHIPKIYTATIERKTGVNYFSQENFLCISWGGELRSGNETIPQWVSVDNLDNYNLLPNVKQMIMDGLEMISNTK